MNKNNTIAYENATQGLLRKIDEMNLSLKERLRAKNLTLLFRDNFKLESVKHATFYQNCGYDYRSFPYDSFGFCRASSFAFVSLMKSPDWQLMYIDDIWTYGPHFYIQHMPSNTVFDLTFDQYAYDGIPIPYNIGRRSAIDADGKNVIVRFLHAVGLDFMSATNDK